MDRKRLELNQNRHPGKYSRDYPSNCMERPRPSLREGRNFADPYKIFCHSTSSSRNYNTRGDNYQFSRINDCNGDPNFQQWTGSISKRGITTQALRGSRGHRNFKPLLQQYLPCPNNNAMKTGRQYWPRKPKGCFSAKYNSNRNTNARKQHHKWEDVKALEHRNDYPNDEGTIASERHDLEVDQITNLDLAAKITTTEDAVKMPNLTDESSQDHSSCEIDIFKLPLCDLLGDVNIENWESMTDEEIKQIELKYLEEC